MYDEARAGNVALAADRIASLADIFLLPLNQNIENLSGEIVARAILPPDAIVDALHIACTAVHKIDCLLTWNCKHIANPLILPRIFRVIDDFQLPFPVICTPQDIMDFHDDSEST